MDLVEKCKSSALLFKTMCERKTKIEVLPPRDGATLDGYYQPKTETVFLQPEAIAALASEKGVSVDQMIVLILSREWGRADMNNLAASARAMEGFLARVLELDNSEKERQEAKASYVQTLFDAQSQAWLNGAAYIDSLAHEEISAWYRQQAKEHLKSVLQYGHLEFEARAQTMKNKKLSAAVAKRDAASAALWFDRGGRAEEALKAALASDKEFRKTFMRSAYPEAFQAEADSQIIS